MSYAAELDDYRQQIRRGSAAEQVRFWPKVPGSGNVLLDAAPSVALQRPDGTSLGTVTGTNVSVGGIHRVNIGIDASNLVNYTLDEGYAAIATYVVSGTTFVRTVRFDVALEPYVPDISINDLIEELAGIYEQLGGLAAAFGASGAQPTTEELASIYGVRAWRDVRQQIRGQLSGTGRIFPRLIIDREEIRAVVAARAIALIFLAEGGGLDSASRALAEDWTARSNLRLSAMGEIPYDSDEDRVEDSSLDGFGVVHLRRV